MQACATNYRIFLLSQGVDCIFHISLYSYNIFTNASHMLRTYENKMAKRWHTSVRHSHFLHIFIFIFFYCSFFNYLDFSKLFETGLKSFDCPINHLRKQSKMLNYLATDRQRKKVMSVWIHPSRCHMNTKRVN